MATIINLTDTNVTNTTSIISISNSQILDTLVSTYSNLLNIQNYTLDTSETSFVNYILQQLSILIGDSLYYTTNIANESTLVTAQLPESIYNWANYLGYTPGMAVPAITSVQISITYNQLFNAIIPSGTQFSASSIIFTSDNDIYIDMQGQNLSLYYIDSSTGIEYPLPYNTSITTTSSQISNTSNILQFSIPVTQQFTVLYQFTVANLNTMQSYSWSTQLSDGVYPVNVQVQSTDSNGNIINWTNGIVVSSTSTDYIFQVKFVSSIIYIEFGNGVQGIQPNGLISVYITQTNGSNGNILSNTITSGQQLYTTTSPSVAPLPLIYSVTNQSPATGGADSESLESVRTNAPLSLSILNRIVTTDDYTNILQIMNLNNSVASFVLPVLKRSDLTVNDINLYTIPIYNNSVMMSDSVAYDITDIYGTTTNEIVPTQIITAYNPLINSSENINWINLFLLKLDYQKNIGNYYYLSSTLSPPLQQQYNSSNSHNTISQIEVIYNMYNQLTDNYTINIYVLISDTSINYTQSISILQNQQYIVYSVTNCTHPAPNEVVFTYTIPRQNLENISNLIISTMENTSTTNPVATTIYYTNFQIETPLNEIAYSYIINYNSRYYLLDLPVISIYSYNNISNVPSFIDNLVGQFMANANNVSNRMMNTQLAVKFARTYGLIVNNLYSTPQFYVSNVLYGNTDPNFPSTPVIGSYYAVSDPIPSTDPWYQYGGSLAIWNGQTWSFTPMGEGTTIMNITNNSLYTIDGTRWYIPNNISLPLNITLEIHLTVPNNNLYNVVTNDVVNYVNNLGLGQSLYLSDLSQVIQNIPGISYVRIISPLSDIIYNNVIDNLNQTQLNFYTPEYLYTTSENITLMIV